MAVNLPSTEYRERFGYRADIDGLRAIAVLGVIGFHAFPRYVTGGFTGVDVFFVVSGYLISRIIFERLDADGFSLVEFYSRRVRRIFPALIVVLLACLGIGWWVLLGDEFGQLGKHSAGGAWFVSNLLLWRESSYFDAEAQAKPLLHLWSLGVEEQFYLVWPLLCYIGYKRRIAFVWIIGVLLAGSFLLNLSLLQDHAAAAFYSPATRFWELMSGALLVAAERRAAIPVLGSSVRNVISVAGLAAILASVFFLSRKQEFPGWWALPSIVGSCLMIAAGGHAVANRLLLARGALVRIGLISYPLYLWHWPLLSLAGIMESGSPSRAVRIAAVAASLLLAWVTFVVVETPIRSSRPVSKGVLPLLGGMFALGCLGLSIRIEEGFPHRYPEIEEQLRAARYNTESTADCKAAVPFKDSRYCLLADPSRAPTVALIGDSHANRLFTGLSSRFASVGENLIDLGGGGCLPFWDIETGKVGDANGCEKQMRPQLDFVLRSPTIHTVILSHRGSVHILGTDLTTVGERFFIRNVRAESTDDRAATYEAALRDAVQRFVTAGKRVVLVIDAPELDHDPLPCLRARPHAITAPHTPECPVMRLDDVQRRDRDYLRLTNTVASQFAGVKEVDLREVLCDVQYCYAKRDGSLLYMDANHLNPAGAEYVASRLWRQFLFQ